MDKLIEFANGQTALTFDDVVLVPAYSEIVPQKIDIKTKLTRNIELKIPIVSAAMDTVTESSTSISLALLGGIGVIHRNLNSYDQSQMVKIVKNYTNWIIDKPVVVGPKDTVEHVKKLSSELGVSGFPVVEKDKLLGMIAGRDLRFAPSNDALVEHLMTKKIITAKKGIGIIEAKNLMHEKRVEKLPLLDDAEKLAGLITYKDVMKLQSIANASLDKQGRLMVAAAVGVDDLARIDALVKEDVDAIVIDTAHGHSKGVIESVKEIKKHYPDLQVIAGNVSTGQATIDLIEVGADAIKVGQGPGSICTTRIVSGAGMPQLTAILECSKAANDSKIPIIADGGIRYSGDIAKAIAAGASCVMLGSLFAGTDESPGRLVVVGGRKFKQYRGMGSVGAMMKNQGARERYHQQEISERDKLVPEGIEGLVSYRGSINEVTFQLIGGLKSGMGYCGARNIEEMKKNSMFARITSAGSAEGHVHNITVTDEPPNYPINKS